MDPMSISDRDFASFQQLLHRLTGIHLAEHKKPLLCGRLAKRLKNRGLSGYGEYYRLLADGDAAELETCINLLTTNETCFFREAGHFDYLRRQLLAGGRGRPLRVWSAACSSGEEPYTLAMVLADSLGLSAPWEILASDLSTAVLEKAVEGIYPLAAAEDIPPLLLQRYCLKGIGAAAGSFAIDRPLRERVAFARINLNQSLPALGAFDVIFLRNVMIYFPAAVKQAVVGRLTACLKPGGHLFIGHSESINGLSDELLPVQPTIYRRREDRP